MNQLHTLTNEYFKSKQIQYGSAASFALRDAGPLRCLHAVPGWPEVDAFYAVDTEAAEAVRAIGDYNPNARHALTVFTNAPDLLVPAYRKLRYAPVPARTSQPLMLKRLDSGIDLGDFFPIRQVVSAAGLLEINAEHQVMNPAHLNDERVRYYYIVQDEAVVCWGGRITTSPHTDYLFSMHTRSEYRRRGLARALVNRMHRDAAARGTEQCILCASPMGLPLYKALGYNTVALMKMFIPEGTLV